MRSMKAIAGGRSAEAFLVRLAREAKTAGGFLDLVNLKEAAERLSWRVLEARVASWRARGRHKADAIERYERVLREVMADIDAHTSGAAFRYDTAHGPLFHFDPLWLAAGRSGSHMGPRASDEPTWTSASRAVA